MKKNFLNIANLDKEKPFDCNHLSKIMRKYRITPNMLFERVNISESNIEKFRSKRCVDRIPSYKDLQSMADTVSLLAMEHCIVSGECWKLIEQHSVTLKQLANELGETEAVVREFCYNGKNRLEDEAEKYAKAFYALMPYPFITPMDLSESYVKIFDALLGRKERKEQIAELVMEQYLKLIPYLEPLDVCNLILNFEFYDELDYNACVLLSSFSFLSKDNKQLVMDKIGSDSLTFKQQLNKYPFMNKYYKARNECGKGAREYFKKNVLTVDTKNEKNIQLKILGCLLQQKIESVYQGEEHTDLLDLVDLSEKLEVIACAWDNTDWDLVFIYQMLEENCWEMSEKQKQLIDFIRSYVDQQYLHSNESSRLL